MHFTVDFWNFLFTLLYFKIYNGYILNNIKQEEEQK